MAKNFLQNKKALIITVVVLAAVLIAGMVFLGIRLWKQAHTVKVPVTQDFNHTVSSDMENGETVTLKSTTGFRDILAQLGGYSQVDEPLYYYDEKGDAVGQYVYDEEGWVYGWRADNGKITKLPEDEQFEAPFVLSGGETLLMSGDVQMHFIVYSENGNPTSAYLYFIMDEAGDMVTFQEAMKRANFGGVEKVADNVALYMMDNDAIDEEMSFFDPEYDIDVFVARLGQLYGVAVQ